MSNFTYMYMYSLIFLCWMTNGITLKCLSIVVTIGDELAEHTSNGSNVQLELT